MHLNTLAEIPKPGDIVVYLGMFFLCLGKLIEWLQSRKKDTAKRKYGDPKTMVQIVKLDESIHEALSQFRDHIKACRTVVYQFHNGERFFSGGPIQRMTAAYEAVLGGASRIMDDQKGLSTSIMSGFLDKMSEDTPTINRTANMLDTPAKAMLDDLSVVEYACIPLYQSHLIIGCLIVHWFVGKTSNPDNPQATRAEYETWFEGQAKHIVKLIEYRLSQRLALSGTHE